MLLFTPAGTVIDIDGNTYQAVKVGNQVWMAENLRTTKYRSGARILDATENSTWGNLTTGAYCNYADVKLAGSYGRLYNWFALNDARNIAPEGWHVPTIAEWDTLIQYLGGLEGSGGKLKNRNGWKSGGNGSNVSGFAALPGGMGLFSSAAAIDYIEEDAYFWSSDIGTTSHACAVWLSYKSDDLAKSCNYYKNFGFSVRCLKDQD